ncbi:MAG: DUF5752 family protein [Candidatus Auribacterota bacterium]|nr:DUF5752 family protein [Candidatus Auribacterota bacterium]
MTPDNSATVPFIFYTDFNLPELTGLTAANLRQLLLLIRKVPGSAIYHHTHRFVEKHQYLTLESPNDFAFWVSDILGEKTLGEKLRGIDIVQFSTIHDLRQALASTIEEYLSRHPGAGKRFADTDSLFHFVKSIGFFQPMPYRAKSLEGFIKHLKSVSISSIYFHMFGARLRLERKTNDFSYWLETSLLRKDLGDRIAELDPYAFTLEGLRKKILTILENNK